jgi:hypothetical protein
MKDPHLKTVAAAKKLIEIRYDTIEEKVRAIGCRRNSIMKWVIARRTETSPITVAHCVSELKR